MSNKLISSILDPVYGHIRHGECGLRDHNNLTVTKPDDDPEIYTPGPDHPGLS